MKHFVIAHRKLSFGGGERVMVERVAALAELPIRISVLFRKEPGKRDVEEELRRRNPNVDQILYLPSALACGKWLWRNRPDFMLLCNHKGVIRALPWLARLGLRIPTAVTLHEHYHHHMRKYRGIRSLVDRWLIDWAFQDSVEACLGSRNCAMIHPLYPRPDTAMITPEQRRQARQNLHLPENGLVLGYVGQIDGRKSPAVVVKLAEEIRERIGQPLTLVFAGRESPDGAQELDRAVYEDDSSQNWIRRLGVVCSVDPVLAALDGYLMTSRNEGFFPIALIEALERGIPIVAPTVGGIATVLKEGHGGFLVRKPDDRQAIPRQALQDAASNFAEAWLDPAAWTRLRREAHELGVGLTRDYDAAALFRQAIAPWL